MKFKISPKDGVFPPITYGDPGRELDFFVPDSVNWTQLNFGQGEGQVLVNACEWGFYFTDDHSMELVLHHGEAGRNDCLGFADKVGQKVFGIGRYDLLEVQTGFACS